MGKIYRKREIKTVSETSYVFLQGQRTMLIENSLINTTYLPKININTPELTQHHKLIDSQAIYLFFIFYSTSSANATSLCGVQ